MSLNTKKIPDQRAQESLRASIIGLACNLLLAALKITAGSLSGAVSVLADGINNLSDSASVLISIVVMRVARKPGDENHPFGHGRMEYIGSLVIAIIILYVGIDLLRASVRAILQPVAPDFSWWILIATAVTLPVKAFMWRFYRFYGKKHDASTLLAASQDSFNDILTTSAVLIGLLALRFFGWVLDGYLGVLVSLIILWGGFQLIRGTINDLIGGRPDEEIGDKILSILKSYPEIKGYHDFVLHDYGPNRSMASIHAEVDANAKLLDIHEVIDQAEQEIQRKLNLPINIHMDPFLADDNLDSGPRKQIADYLSQLDPPLSMHDFRIVPGKRAMKLIFDLVVPAGFGDEASIIQQIEAFAKSLNPKYTCVIRVDHDYFSHLQENQ